MKNKRIHNFCLTFVAAMMLVFGVVTTLPMLTQEAYADSAAEQKALKIALLNGLKTCYNDTYMKKSITGVEYTGAPSLMTSKAFGTDGKSDGVVRVPNMVGNTLTDADISCEQLFNGYNQNKSSNSIKGLISLSGKNPTLTDLGYSLNKSAGSSGASQNCLWYEYSYSDNGITTTGRTERLCFQVTNGEVENINDYNSVVVSGDQDTSIDYKGKTGPVTLMYLYGSYSAQLYVNTGSMYEPVSQVLGANPSWDEVKSRMTEYGKQIDYAQAGNDYTGYYNPYSSTSMPSAIGGGEVYEDYTRDTDGAVKALRYFTGDQNATWTSNVATFDSMDVYTMYSSYFNQAVQAHPNVLSRAADDKCTAENTYTYALYNNGKWCEVTGVENINDTFNGVNMSGDYWTGPLVPMSFADIVKALGKLNYEYIENQGGTVGGLDGVTIDNGNNGDTSVVEDASTIAQCYSGTGVLGWIVCPVIELIGNATGFLYNNFVEPALEVKAETIMSRDKGIYVGWAAFRDIANIIFAIFFIIIILSQVTGIGISNYGIKKVLPRFIMVVVLVNVSFIICQIAVDLSNILGVGLRDIFNRLPLPALPNGQTSVNPGSIAGSIVSMLGLAAGAVAIFQLPVISATIGYWILPILLVLLGCLISVIFFFIILGVRQAGIVILVVLAPVAIICYALPNTKSLFDRWKKLFTALLLVYPICGLLMGGGEYAGALLMSIDTEGDMGFFYTLTAMLVTVVPFFMIPSLLKGSMAMMGNLGAKISSLGKSVRGGITGGIRRTQAFQEHQAERQRTMNMRRNSRIAARNGGERLEELQRKIDNKETLSAREQRLYNRLSYRRARALSGNRKIYNEDNMAAAMAQGDDLAKVDYGSVRRLADIQRYRGRDTEDLSHGYTTMYQNDGTTGSITKQETELEAALKALEADANNQDAQARFKALTRMMSNNDKGRAALEKTFNRRIKERGAAGEDQNAGLQWAANEALAGPNGKEFKRVASSLFNTLNRVAEGGINNTYSTMGADYEADGSLSAAASDDAYKEGIDRMAADILPDIDDREFEKYINGLRNGKIKGTDRAKLISSAIDALNDPRIKLKPKTAKRVHEIANMGYTQNTSSADLHGANFDAVNQNDAAAIASAGSSELDRIAEGFRNGTIAKDDASTGVRSDMLNVIQKALEEARLNDGMVGGVQLSGGDASKMLKILKDNGRALADASGAALTDADYSSLMRIKHSRASYSSNWRQATAADIMSTPGINVGDWIDASGSHPRLLNARELEEVKAVNEFNVRQKVKESADNGAPTP